MKVAVVGAGSWGTALAMLAARRGHPVSLWARESEVVAGITRERRNPLFLPEFELPGGITAESDLAAAAAGARLVVFVVPVQFARAVLGQLGPALAADGVVVSASKGIEVATGERMDQVVAGELGLPAGRFAVLSGPTFAREVAAGLPAAAVVAGADPAVAHQVQHALSSEVFRLYCSADVVGVELAGALKNVVAIAAGLCTGLRLGHNALTALLTRGLHEMTRLGVHLGGREETFRGLAGMGDLVLTCTGELSRNRRVGERLGRGEPLAEVVAGREVAEGVATAGAAAAMARRLGVEMPVTLAVEGILKGELTPAEAVASLMTRELKMESSL